MSEHQKVTTFLRHVILYDDSDEHCKLQKAIAPAQPNGRFVQRFASVIVDFLVVVIVCVGAMAAFAGLLMAHRKNLKRLADAHLLATRRQESHLTTPDIIALPGSYRGSADPESLQGAAESSGLHGGLDSPSWHSNRLCG
jgi:hypothetical protein